MSDSESLPGREVTCDLVYFAAGERTGFTKAEPLAHGVKRGLRDPLSEGSGRGAPRRMGLGAGKPQYLFGALPRKKSFGVINQKKNLF